MDESLMQDFLTESSELIDQLDRDLVRLESASPSEQADLCNACFRALHTIKGAASFLSLNAVTEFAHAAEDALNVLRKGEVNMSAGVMDTLLQSADVVRRQVDHLAAGQQAPGGPAGLIETLHQIASGKCVDAAAASSPAVDELLAEVAAAVAPPQADDKPGRALQLDASKLDLLEFMAADLVDVCQQLNEAISQLANDATRSDGASMISELAEQLTRTAAFFELDELSQLVAMLRESSPKLTTLSGDQAPHVAARLNAVRHLIELQAEALRDTRVLEFEIQLLSERLDTLLAGEWPDGTPCDAIPELAAVLELDGLSPAGSAAAPGSGAAESSLASGSKAASNAPTAADAEQAAANKPAAPGSAKSAAPASPASEMDSGSQAAGKSMVEQTIRVEVNRLEALLNLVGQLVLNKNRMLALTRNLRELNLHQDVVDDYNMAASDLDRLTSELQIGVMRTRMQPLAKLFERYPRVIRDVARMTDKKMQLLIEGKDTEVDKSVLELLADPLVHILRNSADHGIEQPDVRKQANKPETGTIKLQAQHQGSHVRVAIIDDGKGLDREIIGGKAVQRGLCTEDQLAAMSDEEVFRFIFEAGFSTAAKVSDLSGRGVGMDVVRTNVTKLNGDVHISSKKGEGTCIEILIPLTVAIMPAMVVGVGKHLYSIPLQCIVEIIRPEEHGLHLVGSQPVVRLRDSVLPLLDLRKVLGEPVDSKNIAFAVVIQVGTQCIGLCVDRLVGQQEIVIKPLDDGYTRKGPFSGATIREDGEVSLILDVVALMRHTQQRTTAASAA